jgi:ABC-type transport system involved in multi-copper enzyme maturation permease subunit
MTAPTVPARPDEDASPRPVPWRRMAWVTWRQHRFALAGVAALLGALAVYLWLSGLQAHHDFAAAATCRPASSYACGNLLDDFNNNYGARAEAVAGLLLAVPALIGAFVGAPVIGREMETGTFRYTWTQEFGRCRWALAKLVPLAVVVTAAAGAFSVLFTWYLQPFLADGNQTPLAPTVFGLRGLAFAAWTLAAFAIGALAGMLIRRVVAAIAATLAVYAGLALAVMNFLRQHYLTPLVSRNLISPPASAWIISQWWTKGSTFIFAPWPPDIVQRQDCPDSSFGPDGPSLAGLTQCFVRHGYTRWTSYQPASRFWPFQWIEGGWLLALSVLLIAATVWLVRRRAAG